MKKFMVVTRSESGSQRATFFDEKTAADNYFETAAYAMGLDAEVYQYAEANEHECGGYEFLYS